MVKKTVAPVMTSDELRAKRLETQLSQVKMAEAIGLHWNTYSRIERGENPVDARTVIAVLLVCACWHAKQRDKLPPEFGRVLPALIEML
jgi:DNA-binding XRE family transcriptional regulator